jgi:hypothetical protein
MKRGTKSGMNYAQQPSGRKPDARPWGWLGRVLRDEFGTKRRSVWVSLSIGLAEGAIAFGLSVALGLQAHALSMMVGVFCALILWELAGRIAVHAERQRSRLAQSADPNKPGPQP